MKEKIKQYRPAVAAFLTMMAMALTSSTMSFFVGPICDSLGVSRGSFSLIFSLMSVAGALTNPFIGQRAGKKGVRDILVLTGAWGGCCMVLLSMAHSLWLLYLAGFCLGLFGSTCVALCGNVIVQQSYFGPQASSILGAVMAGSGVGGMLFSLVVPGCIASFGWQTGMRIMAVFWAALLWVSALILGKQSPLNAHSGKGAVGLGMTRAEAVKDKRLYLQMLIIVIITACCGLQQQLPSLLSANGFDTATVSVMISAMTAFLAIGKVAQGVLYGRIGIEKGGMLMLGAFALGCLAMLSKALAYPGLILLALGMGIYTTLLPQVVRRIFGSKEYAAIWSLISTVGCAGTFVANPIWGTVYDVTGSYALGLIAAPVLLVVAMWAMRQSLKKE